MYGYGLMMAALAYPPKTQKAPLSSPARPFTKLLTHKITMPTPSSTLATAEATHAEASTAYEDARRTGDPLAIYNAYNRRARAYAALLAAQQAAEAPDAEAIEDEAQASGWYGQLLAA
jgi:hypothetical protein